MKSWEECKPGVQEVYKAVGKWQGLFTAVIFGFVLFTFNAGFVGVCIGLIYGLCVLAYGGARYYDGASTAYGEAAAMLQSHSDGDNNLRTWDDVADLLRERGYTVTHE